VALPIENPSRLNHQTRRVNLAGDDPFCLDFNPPLGEYHAVKFARDNHMIPFDLAFNARAFSEYEAVAGKEVPFHLGIDAKYAGSFQRPFKLHALIEKAGELLAFCVLAASL